MYMKINELYRPSCTEELLDRLLADNAITNEDFQVIKHGLYESTSLSNIEDFMQSQATGIIPAVGQLYMPIGLTFFPVNSHLIIEYSDQPIELVKQNPDDYLFRHNNIVHRFPYEYSSGTGCASTIIFDNPIDINQFMTMLTLRFLPSEWNYEKYSINNQGEKIRIT